MNTWGIFCMEKEVERMKEQVEKSGLEIFEVRKLTTMEKLTYCKDPILYVNDPWVIMFKASKLKYHMLISKLKLKEVF